MGLFTHWVSVARRFPLVVAVSAANGMVGILAHRAVLGLGPVITGTLLMAIPLAFALEVTGEAMREPARRRTLLAMGPPLVLVAIYLSSYGLTADGWGIRLTLYAVFLHLAVAVLPALRVGVDGFWEYNKTLFLRMSLAAFFASLLAGGVALALSALHSLLGWEFNLWAACQDVGSLFFYGFQTAFFLAGIPTPAVSPTANSYPRSVRNLAQGILLPLVAVHSVILGVYVVKLPATASTAEVNLLSAMVMALAVVGTLAHLLSFPRIRESRWVREYAPAFYGVLSVLTVAVVVHQARQISANGLQYGNYFTLLGAVGIFANAIFFGVLRRTDIRFIPVQLAVLSMVGAIGPASAISIVTASQEKAQRHYEEHKPEPTLHWARLSAAKSSYSSDVVDAEGYRYFFHFEAFAHSERRFRLGDREVLVRCQPLENLIEVYEQRGAQTEALAKISIASLAANLKNEDQKVLSDSELEFRVENARVRLLLRFDVLNFQGAPGQLRWNDAQGTVRMDWKR